MIVAELKPFEEIKNMIRDYKKVLVLGCGSCVTVCMSGGERQVELLASALTMARKLAGNEVTAGEKTILRQCDPEFIDQIKDEVSQYDAILSMACGAGVQGIAESLRDTPVLPAMNTTFIGLSDGKGTWVEVCAACGNCILNETGGICPMARCAKSLISGPCGGSRGGMCEVSKDNPCVWQLIYDRLSKLNKLDSLKRKSESKTKPVHPRKMVREDLRLKKEPTKGV
ncbi:MAG TPA: methylenetetrahydrofolate reductase C-terminal domain-containing protein [Thermodesulfovibrionales bacterium]|jgi:ferredoxin|nr:methylenetetrahydrofolate reductase C-terminal domain-containing protein [Thermodesulfovibrionales bacterium]